MKILAILGVLLLLCACASTAAEQTGIIGAGVAGIAAVFDQLMSAGVITPVQHLQIQHGLGDLQNIATSAVQAAESAKAAAASVKAGTLTTEQAVGTAGLITTAGMAILNARRSATRAKVVEKLAAA